MFRETFQAMGWVQLTLLAIQLTLLALSLLGVGVAGRGNGVVPGG